MLADKDRIFLNLYGKHGADLESAKKIYIEYKHSIWWYWTLTFCTVSNRWWNNKAA